MRTLIASAGVAAGLLAGAWLTMAQDAPPEAKMRDPAGSLAKANNEFGFDLLRRLHKDGENTFLSPLSISMALQMTMQGARGETYTEMAKTMHVDKLDMDGANRKLLDVLAGNESAKLNIANSIWADPAKITLNRRFADQVQKEFDAEIRSVSFSDPATKELINAWVSERTEKKIPRLLEELDKSTVTVLVNAIYFKGTWTIQFDKEKTKEADFTLTDGTTKQLKLMSCKDAFDYAETDEVQVIALPYGKEKKAKMWIVLPRADKSLDAVVRAITPEKFAAWQAAARSMKGTIELPRFKMKFREELEDDLPEMGMSKPFGAEADFSGFESDEKNRKLFISQVIHEAVIEVNEEGTEAAAATAVVLGRSSRPREFRMSCNKPFLLAIEDVGTGSLLFAGTVYDPESN